MKCYFENIEKKIIDFIKQTNKTLEIAVTWIDFFLFERIIIQLLLKEVSVIIIVSDEQKLHCQYGKILKLSNIYDNFKCKVYPVNNFNRMHNKFCIIDSRLIITGSYNWTKNSRRNKENILISLEYNIIRKYKKEFLKLSNNSLELKNFLLQKENSILKYCNVCGNKKYKILIISPADEPVYSRERGIYFFTNIGTLLEYCICCHNSEEIDFIQIDNSILDDTSLFLESGLIEKYDLNCVFENYVDGMEKLEWIYRLIWVDDYLRDKVKSFYWMKDY